MSEELKKQGFEYYKKKPIIIHAKKMEEAFEVKTKEGTMKGKAGDYLVIGIEGEKYPVDKKIFKKTYEKITALHALFG